ncbi:AraC family transcriptional regulator [Paenalkalicoccus suaedae]|uniref:AraC family transcriptional regulator n=1 Tax=Paenalkalicoccus suaedae TaxID=2592382 RepID=A0A859FGL0_9BACI|nr:AraC family transcriptional regulator [Paenalkalicoccus suaedae]QKS72503.1 AraC family transcriptional regulator [Paenalkalicoccus suaedae]
MYKIILVDDDYYVLEFLKTMVPWQSLGYEVIGVFEDGDKALEVVKKSHVDVIMTDIGMPRLDGISLIKEAKQHREGIHSIFLTCYDEFDYAHQAIKLNSFEYVLKEKMDTTMITDIVSRLKDEMDKKKQKDRELSNIRFLVKENLTVLRGRLLDHLMRKPPAIVNDWIQKHKADLNLDLSMTHCTPVLAFVDSYEALLTDDSYAFSVENIVMETINQYGKGFCLFDKEDKFYLFFDEITISKKVLLQRISDNLNTFMNVTISAIIGQHCVFPHEVSLELATLQQAEEQRFYLKQGEIDERKSSSSLGATIFEQLRHTNSELKELLLLEDNQKLHSWLEIQYAIINANQFSAKQVRNWAHSFLLDIERTIQMMQEDKEVFRLENESNEVLHVKTMWRLYEILKNAIAKAAEMVKDIHRHSSKPEIVKAKKYVMLHLDKKITLKDVSEHLHLNPSYFSRLFKQQTEMTFIDFVNKTKIERAKELMDHSQETVESISDMLGFESKSYFLKVFKKYYGATPSQYKTIQR